MRYLLTPSQTVGPYLHIGFEWLNATELASADTPGERIRIEGRLVDAEGVAVPDGVIEIWQANASGDYAPPPSTAPHTSRFSGFGRCATDEDGRFHFSTIKPGAVPAADGGVQAPHIMVNIFARGLLKQLVTRLYFPGDAHDHDFVFQQVPVARRTTLIAQVVPDRKDYFYWPIALGGRDETVFFEI